MMKYKFIVLFSTFLFFNPYIIKAQNPYITPQPQEINFGKDYFEIDVNTRIISTEESFEVAKTLQNHLVSNFGFNLTTEKDINLKINFISFNFLENLPKEGYRLSIEKEKVIIFASNASGWFYGLQSFLQLMPTKVDKYENIIRIKEVTINDAPRFKWRAFMLDEARHFKGIKQVKMLLDEMAFLKMNVFHWHLVDDQGWRIEIKKYPLLTKIGSKRKSTQIGPLQWESPIQSAEPHEGFYTQEEIKEIINYAKERHITIVPEIEMPGHSTAAIAAYSWLGTSRKEIEVPIKFGVGKDVYDVTNPRTYRFLTDVLDEIMALFPSEVIHIGGDEVKYNHWKSSLSVQDYMRTNKLATPADLQVYFTNNISQYLQKNGRRMMGWNEIMGHNLHYYQDEKDTKTTQSLAKESIVHFWKGDVKLATTAASAGYEIVNSLHTHTYLDYSYKNLNLYKAYNFNPIPEDLDPKYHDKIIGLGCQMWGEWIPTNGEMHYLVFPRIAAYAEVGWTKIENKNYDSFSVSLKKLQERWNQKGIYFAPH